MKILPGNLTLFSSVVLCLVFSACQTGDLHPIGSQTTTTLSLYEDEERIWKRSREEQARFDSSGHLYENPVLQEYLNSIAQRIVPPEVSRRGLTISVRIIKNPLLNAFAYPHGVIYIHTGLLARMENEAQLAALLGHEMTHSTHRHAIQNMRTIKNTAAVVSSLSIVATPFGFGSIVGLLGSVGGMAAVTGYSRGLEEEADREGLALMVNAGYDPREAPKLFEHLKKDLEEEKREEPFFFGTHPRVQERIESYHELISEKYSQQQGEKGEEPFLKLIVPLLRDNAEFDLSMGRYISAAKGVTRYLTLNSHDPHAHFILGEIYSQRGEEGDRENAIAAYEKAIVLDENFPKPHEELGILYWKAGNVQKAKVHFEKYLSLSPGGGNEQFIRHYLHDLGSTKDSFLD